MAWYILGRSSKNYTCAVRNTSSKACIMGREGSVVVAFAKAMTLEEERGIGLVTRLICDGR